jgi:glycoside/pentoside/hexuronide:cation symporter, GPH family
MTFGRKVLFLSGQLGLMMLARFFFQWIIKYSTTVESGTEVVGDALFSAGVVGAVLLGFRVFDGITDPLAGALTDWWVRKGKERRSLLWYAFLLPPIGLALCFAPEHSMSEMLRWLLLTSGMFVFFVGYTLYCIPYWSLVSDYSSGDESTQCSLSTLLGAGILLATAVGFIISPILISNFGFFVAAVLFGLVSVFLMILPYFAKPKIEGKSQNNQSNKKPVPLLKAMSLTMAHRRFLALIVLLAGSQMSLTMMTGAAPFIAIDLLAGGEADVAKLMGPFLGTAIPFFIVTPWFSRRFGWEKSLVVSSVLLGVIYAMTGALGQAVIGSPMTTAMLLFSLGGPMVAILLGLEAEGITECAEERGGNSVSVYWGVHNLVVKGSNGVSIWICGILATRVGLSDGWLTGTEAVRAMSFIAGLFLAVGVVAYFVIKMLDQHKHST